MRSGTLLSRLALALASAALASADCLDAHNGHSELKWNTTDQQELLTDLVGKRCADGTLNGAYGQTGTFNDRRTASYQVRGTGVVYRFLVKRINWPESGRDLPEDECSDGLLKEIEGCEFGGESAYDNWSYRAQPIDEPSWKWKAGYGEKIEEM